VRTIRKAPEMQAEALRLRREGKRIGFVPTMGYLHEGHLSLLREARKRADALVVSIFVNPAQFGPAEDLSSYPRDLERDLAMCAAAGADIVFAPADGEIYPPGYSTYVVEERLSRGLCGASRPGHFRGVATVVAKLFNLVLPEVAVFGSKDYQQARVIERMARDLNFPVEILVAPTVRETDGLAMSSRNKYLSPQQPAQALCLFRALEKAREMTGGGERSLEKIVAAMKTLIEAEPEARLDYIEARDAANLEPMTVLDRPTVIALAVFIGSVRLIDNAVLAP